jgi:hypothetical protein
MSEKKDKPAESAKEAQPPEPRKTHEEFMAELPADPGS